MPNGKRNFPENRIIEDGQPVVQPEMIVGSECILVMSQSLLVKSRGQFSGFVPDIDENINCFAACF